MSRKSLIFSLCFITLILLTANLFVGYSELIRQERYPFTRLFYFDRRLNIPFYFSVCLSLINLGLLVKITRGKILSKGESVFWTTLLIAFALFTLDETFYIHQHFKMSTFGRIASYNEKSWTHYIWVIPYFFVFGILMAILIRSASVITHDLRRRLVFAGLVFLSGAVVMEFAGTYYVVINPSFDFSLLLIKTTEGVLQMIGSIMFINTFLKVVRGTSQP